MVDINLMGEEEESREERQSEENFAQTVNLNFGDTADEEEKASPFQRESIPRAYPRETIGGSFARTPSMSPSPVSGASRNRAYLLVAALILAALFAVYLILISGRRQAGRETAETGLQQAEEPVESIVDTFAAETPAPSLEPAPPPETETEALASLSPMARSLLASTRLGAYTVSALGQSFGGENDFSLITFYGSNNSFLVEFLAPTSAAISEVIQALQRSASPQELRTVSQLPASGNGRSMNNVLVSGRVSERAGLMGPQGKQQSMNFTQFSAWLQKLGSDHALRLKLFDTGRAYSGDDVLRTPVRVNFSGTKENVFDFLRGLADAGPSIAMSKIIVSPSDRQALRSNNLDLVLNFDFVEMQ
jgi:hypothetical protein